MKQKQKIERDKEAEVMSDFAKMSDEEFAEFMREVKKRFGGSQIPPKEYLTIRQTCELLNVCRSTLWRWHKEGVLKPIKIKGRVMFARSGIDKLMQEGGTK